MCARCLIIPVWCYCPVPTLWLQASIDDGPCFKAVMAIVEQLDRYKECALEHQKRFCLEK